MNIYRQSLNHARAAILQNQRNMENSILFQVRIKADQEDWPYPTICTSPEPDPQLEGEPDKMADDLWKFMEQVDNSGLCQDGNTSSRTITEVKHLELNQLSDGRPLLESGECYCIFPGACVTDVWLFLGGVVPTWLLRDTGNSAQ